jgi:hypothetical protein
MRTIREYTQGHVDHGLLALITAGSEIKTEQG